MYRSPAPFRSSPPAPRSPSSSSAPVMSEPGMTSAGGTTGLVEHELDRAAFFQHADVLAGVRLLRQAVHDLDAGEVALVHGAVVRLPGERLLVDPPVGMAVEEAAVAPLQLED